MDHSNKNSDSKFQNSLSPAAAATIQLQTRQPPTSRRTAARERSRRTCSSVGSYEAKVLWVKAFGNAVKERFELLVGVHANPIFLIRFIGAS